MAYESRFAFSICPRIKAEEDRLTASTSWFACLLTLGLLWRQVVVDRPSRTVTIDQRTAWLFHQKRHFSFAGIASVTYGYEDANPFAFLFHTHDAIDRYVVGLRVFGKDEVRLFSFIGEGVFTNNGPLPDWWYWDEYVLDFSGTQGRESKLFVQLLSKLIGVTITPSTLTRE